MTETPNQWGMPNTRMAELFNAMVGAYETWAEPLSARPSKVALEIAEIDEFRPTIVSEVAHKV